MKTITQKQAKKFTRKGITNEGLLRLSNHYWGDKRERTLFIN